MLREMRPEMLEWTKALTTPGWDAGNLRRLFLSGMGSGKGLAVHLGYVLHLSMIEDTWARILGLSDVGL